MRKLITLLILLVAFTATTSTSTRLIKFTKLEQEQSLERFKYEIELREMKKMYAKGLEGFLEHLAQRESSGNPNIVNTYGYIGKYQFGRAALKEVGCDSVTVGKFIKDPNVFPEEVQDKAVVRLMKINRTRIGKLVDKYKGTTINGIEITEAGLLAAAHLAGAGGVRRFLKSRGSYNPADGYGTRLTNYLKDFQHHKVNLKYV